MPRKPKQQPIEPEINDGITHCVEETVAKETVEYVMSIRDVMLAAAELISAQGQLIECYHLRKPRTKAQARMERCKQEWETLIAEASEDAF